MSSQDMVQGMAKFNATSRAAIYDHRLQSSAYTGKCANRGREDKMFNVDADNVAESYLNLLKTNSQ